MLLNVTLKLMKVCVIRLRPLTYFNNNFQAQASESQECGNQCENNVSEKAPEMKIIISKLNPEVHEFVPNNIKSKNLGSKNHSLDTLEEFSNGEHASKTLGKAPKITNSEATYSNSMNQKLSPESSEASHETGRNGAGDCGWVQMDTKDEEKNKMIAMLKQQIINIPKDSPFDKRKDRNVAIAALIKANTIPSTASNLKSSSPSPIPMLLTPDYFKGPSTSENMVTQLNENFVPSPSTSSQKQLEKDNSKDIEIVEDNVLEENITPNAEVTPMRTSMDPYVQESIVKVNNWFNGPQKSKPAHQGTTLDISKLKRAEPYLGTKFIFKKKSVPDRNSPKSDISRSKTPVLTTPSYVPSKYAQELVKKYTERNQVKEVPLDIWAKLERDLKIKDEEYRLRMRERAAQSKDNNASSNSTL